ncbi:MULTISPECIES: hypothetical protein [unclassified Sulfitobacter]|uniref:hypothetical protein n=1 Tax=unclassified Sulfitobacter TaxID=196795 RepID=UPI0007C371BD|nr:MULTISPECIES: hypothetical protein [unclassified Sulfitobacter]KZX99909.1 hypothetical protein A3720_11770 [Sulfitobacter sp. HI0021]KZY00166.1 hypothetical protein A3722_11440 [Sulfitobacter sp. HI0027]KZZ00412.1 hypothetical protein A3747_05270 [Sulfitobacter sp. HI0076]
MDEQAQKDGQKRVRILLIDQLERMGLTRPAGMTKAQLAAMQDELCQRLAYMSEDGLGALAEDMAGRGGGKERDRFPLAARVLEQARRIEAPQADASPLVRKVFAARLGQEALARGFAPELMRWLRANRQWPTSYVVKGIEDGARDNLRRAEDLRMGIERGRDLSGVDRAWLDARQAEIVRCSRARDLGLGDATRNTVKA